MSRPTVWPFVMLSCLILVACSGRDNALAPNAREARSDSQVTAGPSATDEQGNTTLVEAVLAMEIFHVDSKNYLDTTQTGEVPFTYRLDQTEIDASGEGKLIYTLSRPPIGNAPACNFYFEAKLVLTLKGTISLTNGPADDICRLKGTLSQTPVEPGTSVNCPNFGPVDESVFIKAYTTSQPIDIPIYQGSSNSHSITSSSVEATLAADDNRVEFAAGENLQTNFYIKNLKTHPEVCKVPTPTTAP